MPDVSHTRISPENSGSGLHFLLAFLATILLAVGGVDRLAVWVWPDLTTSLRVHKPVERFALETIKEGAPLFLQVDAKRAKAQNLFWAADAEGDGFGVNVLADENLFDALFPGYGVRLRTDNALWKSYFQLPFGPDSYLISEPRMSQLGFRVAYSWTGCFRIYEKYGADVLVLGSSEVYKALIPGLLAQRLRPLFPVLPRVLFCMTHGMPMESVAATARELRRISPERPSIVVWGYSFWLAYSRSAKLNEYSKEKLSELEAYRAATAHWGMLEGPIGRIVAEGARIKLADWFPQSTWDGFFRFSLSKTRAVMAAKRGGDREGVEVPSELVTGPDEALSAFLKANLRPYYAINSAISESDCSLSQAAKEFEQTAVQLRAFAERVYVYLAPTTRHHLQTAPDCFVPAVSEMISSTARLQKFEFLSASPKEFGLTDRDFLHSTRDDHRLYFDINHANFPGGVKITERVSTWIRSDFESAPRQKSR